MTPTRSVGLLIISIAGTVWLCSENATVSARPPVSRRKQEQTLPRREVRFEPKSALDGVTAEGFRFSSETWEGDDGVAVFLRRQHCLSPRNAERALRRRANGARKVFESKILRDNKGAKSGRRVVVSFSGLQRPRMIMWTDRDMLYTVESSSFQHALLFEKMLPGL